VSIINVNLKPCDCVDAPSRVVHGHHAKDCASIPVLIPCPIPRSIHLMLSLGECICGGHVGRGPPAIIDRRSANCPARPVKVAASIGGKTWEESTVSEWDGDVSLHDDMAMERARAAVRARWALVKALVLGADADTVHGHDVSALRDQRDAVFAALCDMARAEETALQAQQRVDDAIHFSRYRLNDADHRADRPSRGRLAAYVEHLRAVVGSLP
jgi:hypothetical protein